jgi:predicted nucleic acid-binding protein
MMPPIMIDTNLLVYLYDTNEPERQSQAQRVLDYLEISSSGRLSVQNLAEFCHVIINKLDPPLTPSEALHQVELFMSIWPVFDLTPMVVIEACRGVQDHQLSYYDAQVWATARLNQVLIVFSEDFQHNQVLEGVRFVNPFAPDFSLENF